jgi:hypothetical protein
MICEWETYDLGGGLDMAHNLIAIPRRPRVIPPPKLGQHVDRHFMEIIEAWKWGRYWRLIIPLKQLSYDYAFIVAEDDMGYYKNCSFTTTRTWERV